MDALLHRQLASGHLSQYVDKSWVVLLVAVDVSLFWRNLESSERLAVLRS